MTDSQQLQTQVYHRWTVLFFPSVGLSFHTAAAFHELFRNLITSKMSLYFYNMIKIAQKVSKAWKKGKKKQQ